MNLNPIFAPNMILAKGLPIRIFGEGAGKAVICFAGFKKALTSESDKWVVEFPPMEYGGPYTLVAEFEDNRVVLENIYIGEVFLFAGQSNMQFKLKESNTPKALYYSNDKLRLYSTDRIEKTDFYIPKDGWVICEKEKIGNWSALAYLVGNEISKVNDIPVGVITCYQGASVIESWVPERTFEKANIEVPKDKKHMDHTLEEYAQWNRDGSLYSYALSQVFPYSVSAVVWYQGESDTTPEEGLVYCDELAELINAWRKAFHNKNLPFFVIQLADYILRADEGWRLVQKAQEEVSQKIHCVKTIFSADVCENDDIHPKTKIKLAKRISSAIQEELKR